jgi:hypothetical protein
MKEEAPWTISPEDLEAREFAMLKMKKGVTEAEEMKRKEEEARAKEFGWEKDEPPPQPKVGAEGRMLPLQGISCASEALAKASDKISSPVDVRIRTLVCLLVA